MEYKISNFILILSISLLLIFFCIKASEFIDQKNIKSEVKQQIIKLAAHPYNIDVNILLNLNINTSLQFIQQQTDSTATINDLIGNSGATFYSDYGTPTVWLDKFDFNTNKDACTLQHELFHTVMYIMQRAGIDYSNQTEEAYAYLLDNLTQQFYNKIQ